MQAEQLSRSEILKSREPPLEVSVPKTLHRLREVRQRLGKSKEAMAKLMGKPVAQVEAEENEQTDISLTTLRDWQQALNVPFEELLVDDASPLSMRRLTSRRLHQLHRLATQIVDHASDRSTRAFARGLLEQLTELMVANERLA